MASSTIITHRTLTFPGSPEAAQEAMHKAMVERKGTIIESEGDISAKFGSQAMLRLIGGWLISTKSFPVRAHATFTAADGGTKIDLKVADAMGVGLKSGMKGKYERAVTDLAGDLVMAMS